MKPTKFSVFSCGENCAKKSTVFSAIYHLSPKLLLASAFFLFCLIPAAAANFNVTTTADNETDGCGAGQCTLREAIDEANDLSGADSISFQPGLSGTITLTNGHLFINGILTIDGPGARNLSVSGNNAGRVFIVSGSDSIVDISGLTITGGNALPVLIGSTLIGDGGGILNTNGATLNLTEVNVTGNRATSLGGGVATRAILLVSTVTNITRSLISNNSAVAGGGGISNVGTTILSSAVTTITNSTVTDNTTLAEGGGISNTAGILNSTNNTISHNRSVLVGGGVVNVAGVLVGTFNMRNTLLARNNAVVGTNLISSDGIGIFNSLGNNLIGNNLDIEASFAASAVVGGNPLPNVNADIVGSVSIGFQIIDPLLGALQNNFGPTDTRAILTGSPAVNRGNNCVGANTCAPNPQGNNPPFALTTDQRGTGFVRIFGPAADIGAYELQLIVSAANVFVSGQVTRPDGSGISGARISITDANGTTRAITANQFGYYRFDDLTAGETYIFEISGKGHTFRPAVITLNEDLTDLNFVAAETDLNYRLDEIKRVTKR